MRLAVVLLVAILGSGAGASPPRERALTVEDRTRAEQVIARVDDRQRIGAAESAALETLWRISLTDEMLERELARMASEDGSPERLLALYAALGNDPWLIKECLARPSLVERMSRDRFAFDPALHAKARAAATELRRRLATGELSPLADHPGRSVFELAQRETEAVEPFRYRLSAEEFQKRRAQLPGTVLQVSALEEEYDAFVLNVVLDESARTLRVARYVVPKTNFAAWWATAQESLRAEPIVAVATDRGPLPIPRARPASRRLFSGTKGSASDLDLYGFCAAAGHAVVVGIEGDAGREPTPSQSGVLVFDSTGTQMTTSGDAWVAPYTGAFAAGVFGEATPAKGEYVVSIGVSGWSAAQDSVDLSVTTSVTPEPVDAGGLLIYTTVMTNAGPGTALDATMLDPLPVGTTFVSLAWSGSQGSWDCTLPVVGANGKVSCSNKCFAPGDSVTFTITVTVDICVGATELKNIATASCQNPDSVPADNSATAATTVVDSGSCDDGNVCTAGDHCGPAPGFNENFDDVEAPAIPAGWSVALVAGPPGAGSWRTKNRPYDTEPNSAFILDAPDIRDCILDSPSIPILAPDAQLTFRNLYDLEVGFDGGVLEIQIGGAPFRDILAAGGSFVTGDYNGTISELFNSPIHGRRAWTGTINQFVLTTVNLPAAAFGQNVVLRWRMATDQSRGNVGQWIDSVYVTGPNSCGPGATVACDDNDACTADSCDGILGCRHALMSCDDGNLCTDDTCDPSVQCVYTNNSVACDDQNACTRFDACRAGACVGSSPLVCHDTNLCTTEVCDPAIGCAVTSSNFDTVGFSAARVDGRDLVILAGAWNSCPGDARYNVVANLDLQQPCIGPTDFHLFMTAFGRNCAP